MLGVIRFALNYPAFGLLFALILKAVPSLAAKRKAHMTFTEEKLQKRLDRDTDRKDLIAYVNLSINHVFFRADQLGTPRSGWESWTEI